MQVDEDQQKAQEEGDKKAETEEMEVIQDLMLHPLISSHFKETLFVLPFRPLGFLSCADPMLFAPNLDITRGKQTRKEGRSASTS